MFSEWTLKSFKPLDVSRRIILFVYSQAKGMRKKLSRLEEENETLQLQLNKMSTKAKVFIYRLE